MKRKINLYWYKYKEGHGNFGDELNPYIMNRISTQKFKYINTTLIKKSKKEAVKTLLYLLYIKRISIKEFFQNMSYNFIYQPKVLYGIGSILKYNALKNVEVWGSGIIYKDSYFTDSNFYAVRGKYTQKRIQELGYKAPEVLGDPALLLPIVYKPKSIKKYKIGVIPHYMHFADLKHLNNKDVLLINLLDPIEKIIDEINACQFTLSTSLHGIIVSHAYQIPSLWIDMTKIVQRRLVGDNIKFKDYFSSVGIEDYDAISIDFDNLSIEQLENEYSAIVKPTYNLLRIQKELLKVAPFELKEEFKIYIND